MSIHSNLSTIIIKILTTCLQGNYGLKSLGEFSSMSHGVFGAERVEYPASFALHLSIGSIN